MLDGFGKSLYSLALTLLKISLEIGVTYVLLNFMPGGSAILLGITFGEVVVSVIYYVFLRYLFLTFEDTYRDRQTVKNFNSSYS